VLARRHGARPLLDSWHRGCVTNIPVAAHEPPFALDGTVTAAKLRELLGVQTELTWLDYKGECEISGARGLVEITKDVGALMIQGGYLVIGADDTGAPVGLPAQQAKLFDQATLSNKLAKYLAGGFEVRCAVHDLEDGSTGGSKLVAIVWAAPHPDGWCIFTRDGEYMENGKKKIAFRQGDVYARHGTRSERWGQSDIAHARRLLVAREKDSWRGELAGELQRATQAVSVQTAAVTSPAAAFSWQVDAAAFEAAAVELIRRDDDVPVRRMLRGAQADTEALLDAGNASDLITLLDRVTTTAALGLELGRRPFFETAVALLLELYESGLTSRTTQTAGRLPVQQLWLRIAERLYGLGALAVRLRDWSAVRALAVARVPSLEVQSRQRTWHRHALREASNSRLLEQSAPAGTTRVFSLLLFARAAVLSNSALHPDLPGEVESEPSGRDRLLTSLCQFDLLVTVVSGIGINAATERELLSVSYPNFGQFDNERVGAIAQSLITHTEERETLIPNTTDDQVAIVLYLADQAARKAGGRFFGWEGYHDESIAKFVKEHVRLSD